MIFKDGVGRKFFICYSSLVVLFSFFGYGLMSESLFKDLFLITFVAAIGGNVAEKAISMRVPK